jgi:hypothetical protein
MKLRLLVLVAGIGAAAAFAAAATADPFQRICNGPETALFGPVTGNLTVSGNVYVPDGATLAVSGNLTIAPGACFDAYTQGTVTVGGNLKVGNGAVLGLGCSADAEGPTGPCMPAGNPGFRTNDVVGGNLVANGPYTMYITASTIHGNLVSNGGGDPSLPPGLSYPIKATTVDGNLIVQGWQGAWMGVLRSTVGGNMIISRNVGTRPDENGNPDSTEIVSNQVSGNLICLNNTPTARIGDAPGGPNSVGGRAIGECAAISN